MKAELYKKLKPQFREISDEGAQAMEKMTEATILMKMYINRNTDMKIRSMGQQDDLMVRGKRTTTYAEGAKNLFETSNKVCKNERLIKIVNEAVSEMLVCELAPLRMISHWNNPKESQILPLQDDANLIHIYVSNTFLLHGTYSIKQISEATGINRDTLKQACQADRILTAYKVNHGWFANIKEVAKIYDLDLDKIEMK